jgi:hypothetical protein
LRLSGALSNYSHLFLCSALAVTTCDRVRPSLSARLPSSVCFLCSIFALTGVSVWCPCCYYLRFVSGGAFVISLLFHFFSLHAVIRVASSSSCSVPVLLLLPSGCYVVCSWSMCFFCSSIFFFAVLSLLPACHLHLCFCGLRAVNSHCLRCALRPVRCLCVLCADFVD